MAAFPPSVPAVIAYEVKQSVELSKNCNDELHSGRAAQDSPLQKLRYKSSEGTSKQSIG